ncbi:MAG: hypothetical protein KTR29_09800 [Rhodothermaceae bacterium]|nr:hypothetical protein [Rhodothermaceae bacterium]
MRRCLLSLCMIAMLGCGAREEIVISSLSLEQSTWDSLRVSVSFARRTVLGKDTPVQADSLLVVGYNALYDTLFVGKDSVLTLDDANLGNRERLLLEICGQVRTITVCDQSGIEASPKRISLSPEISYPYRDRVYQGSYKLPFIVERQAFDTPEESWEQISRSETIAGFIQAYVEGEKDESIQFPFSKKQGGFNLTHYPNYQEFKYLLDSKLYDFNEASVQFDVFVDINGFTDTVGSISKKIAPKSDEEQQVDVAQLAKLAAEQLVDRLSPYLNDRRNVVFIDSWDYNIFKKKYTINMEVEWEGRQFTRQQHSLQGTLEVFEPDQRSNFRLKDTNRRTRRLWDRITQTSLLNLQPLGSYNDDLLESPELANSTAFTFDDRTLLIEAESFHQARSRNNLHWTLDKNRNGYGGSGAMVVLPDRGIRIRDSHQRESPALDYKIMFPERGTYYIWLRSWAKDNNSNSLILGLNGTPLPSYTKEIETDEYEEWHWTRSLMTSRRHARVEIRSPGIHTLNIWMREDGLYLDRILITKRRSDRPERVATDEI